jgi:hypothetical protein
MNKKITDLIELTTPVNGDYLVIVDVSDTTDDPAGTSKKIQRVNIAPTITANSVLGIYNVKDYGAVGDGVADDTAAIQAAIDAVVALGGYSARGEIYFPTGIYLVSAALTANSQYAVISFAGDGRGGSIIRTNSTTADIFTLNSTLPFVFKNLQIDGYGITRTTGSIAINIGGYGGATNTGSSISNCYLQALGTGIVLSPVIDFDVHDCIIDVTKTAIIVRNTLLPDSGDSIIHSNIISGPVNTADTYGIIQNSSGGLKIYGNKILNFDFAYILNLKDGTTGSLIINSNSFENQKTASLGFYQSDGLVYAFKNITISGNQFGGYLTGYDAIIFGGAGGIGNATITNNVMNGFGDGTAIAVDYLSEAVITGNAINGFTNGITIAATSSYIYYGPNGYFTVTNPVINNGTNCGSLHTLDPSF